RGYTSTCSSSFHHKNCIISAYIKGCIVIQELKVGIRLSKPHDRESIDLRKNVIWLIGSSSLCRVMSMSCHIVPCGYVASIKNDSEIGSQPHFGTRWTHGSDRKCRRCCTSWTYNSHPSCWT